MSGENPVPLACRVIPLSWLLMMPDTQPMTAQVLLDRHFLEMRARLLDLAAALDRIERGSGSVAEDPRMEQLRAGIRILEQARSDRAEQMQLLFSRTYNAAWRADFRL